MKLTGFNGQTLFCEPDEATAVIVSQNNEQAEVYLKGSPAPFLTTKADALKIIQERKWD